jgi:hypothetical protein
VIQASYVASDAAVLKGMAVEHEAALEEAARLQAEEEARLHACPASECGPWPEEGGAGEPAEVYDPEGLASYKRTNKRAEELRKDALNGALIGLAVNVLGVEGGAEAGADYAAGLNESAHNLEECVKTGKSLGGGYASMGTCFINEWRAEKWGVGVPLYATAEFCGYVGQVSWGKKKHNVYYCEESEVDRWGPWF